MNYPHLSASSHLIVDTDAPSCMEKMIEIIGAYFTRSVNFSVNDQLYSLMKSKHLKLKLWSYFGVYCESKFTLKGVGGGA